MSKRAAKGYVWGRLEKIGVKKNENCSKKAIASCVNILHVMYFVIVENKANKHRVVTEL